MSAQQLYHMVQMDSFQACLDAQKPYFPPTYEQDGFTHLTADPALLLTVANHFYTSSQGDWEVLVLDSSRLTAEVKYEPAAPVGNTSSGGLLGGGAQQEQQAEQPQEPLFPHLYGALDLTAVVRRVPMQRAEDGSFTGIAGLV